MTGIAKSNISPGVSNTKRDSGSMFRVKKDSHAISRRDPSPPPPSSQKEEETSKEEKGTFDNVAAVRGNVRHLNDV